MLGRDVDLVYSAGAGGAKGERPIHVSSYRYMCVLILLYRCAQLAEERRRRAVVKSPTNYLSVCILLCLCPHTNTRVSSYILLYVCPHTIMSVPSYYHMSVLIHLCVSSY